jgi:indolepyruvate decarboxylase
MAEPVVCASAIMKPQNVAYETERLIAEALYHRRPAKSDVATLRSVADAVLAALEKARTACILPGLRAVGAGLRKELQSFVDASGLPFATMVADKSVLDEQQPACIGMYDGGSWMSQCGASWSRATWSWSSER